MTSWFGDIKQLFTNFHYVLLMLSFSMTMSIYTIVAATVGPIAKGFNFDSMGVSLFGGVFIICGLVASFVHAFILDKLRYFKT